jgi:hypothetical protein
MTTIGLKLVSTYFFRQKLLKNILETLEISSSIKVAFNLLEKIKINLKGKKTKQGLIYFFRQEKGGKI